MISLTNAMEWNTKGASSMATGDYAEAILSFRQALNIARTVALNSTNPLSQFQTFFLEEVKCLPTDSQASCKVFGRCFNVFTNGRYPENPTKSEVDFLIAICLYNIALACQQEAQCGSSENHGYSETALRIYSMSASVLQVLGVTRDNLSVLLAISNNMACLSLEKYDFRSFHCYREWMGYLIISNKEFHYAFFSSNFASTYNVQERPAPAA